MKTQKLIVIAAIVCLLVGASGAAMAHRPWRSNHVQPDIPGLVAEAVAQGLAAEGYEVKVKAKRDGSKSVRFVTDQGIFHLKLPATLEALERGEITLSLDGNELPMPGDADLLQDFGGDGPNLFGGPGPNLIQCIFTSIEIFILSLGQCAWQGGQCVIESYFDLVLNILKCVEGPG